VRRLKSDRATCHLNLNMAGSHEALIGVPIASTHQISAANPPINSNPKRERTSVPSVLHEAFIVENLTEIECIILTRYLLRRFRLFSGCWGEVQCAAVEVDGVDEVLFVAETAGRVPHPLNLGVDGFAGRVGDAVLEVDDDVLKAPFEHAATAFIGARLLMLVRLFQQTTICCDQR